MADIENPPAIPAGSKVEKLIDTAIPIFTAWEAFHSSLVKDNRAMQGARIALKHYLTEGGSR